MNIAISPARQRQGFGRQLLTSGKHRQAQGVERVCLRCGPVIWQGPSTKKQGLNFSRRQSTMVLRRKRMPSSIRLLSETPEEQVEAWTGKSLDMQRKRHRLNLKNKGLWVSRSRWPKRALSVNPRSRWRNGLKPLWAKRLANSRWTRLATRAPRLLSHRISAGSVGIDLLQRAEQSVFEFSLARPFRGSGTRRGMLPGTITVWHKVDRFIGVALCTGILGRPPRGPSGSVRCIGS